MELDRQDSNIVELIGQITWGVLDSLIKVAIEGLSSYYLPCEEDALPVVGRFGSYYLPNLFGGSTTLSFEKNPRFVKISAIEYPFPENSFEV